MQRLLLTKILQNFVIVDLLLHDAIFLVNCIGTKFKISRQVGKCDSVYGDVSLSFLPEVHNTTDGEVKSLRYKFQSTIIHPTNRSIRLPERRWLSRLNSFLELTEIFVNGEKLLENSPAEKRQQQKRRIQSNIIHAFVSLATKYHLKNFSSNPSLAITMSK